MVSDMEHTSYDPVAKGLHWLVFILLAIEFVIAWTMPELKKGDQPTALVELHFSFGILILLTIIIRLLWRAAHPHPAPLQSVARWQNTLAIAMHHTLYASLVVMPFAGWAWASGRGWPISFFGLFPLPHLISAGSSLGRIAGMLHGILGGLIVLMIIAHAGMALYHHYVLKNETLKRMLP